VIYRIVQCVDGHLTVSETTDVAAWASAAGVAIVGLHRNPRTRAELQNQPILASFCGPMWDGGRIRYEDTAANDMLST
jgi:hypothetical protein